MLKFIDGIYYPLNDIGLKYDGWNSDSSFFSISSTTRRSGPSSIYLPQNTFNYGYLTKQFGEDFAKVFIGFAVRFSSNLPAGSFPFLTIMGGGQDQLTITPLTNGGFKCHSNQSGDYLTTTGHITLNVWLYFEIAFVSNATTGYIQVRVNGVPILTQSGIDTDYYGDDFVSGLQFDAVSGSGGNCNMNIQDFYICDATGSVNNDFLGDIRVDICRPNAPGSTTDFAPSAGANWENVDEVDCDDDSTYNESKIVNNIDLYNLDSITAIGADIFGIQQQSVVRKTDVSARSVKQAIKSGTTQVYDDEHALSNTFVGYRNILETDPDTSAAWTESGINALESGVKVTV